jgi:hypothetical protein
MNFTKILKLSQIYLKKAEKTHYDFDPALVVKQLKYLNDEDGIREFIEEYGGYHVYSFEMIPISKLQQRDVWSEDKLASVSKHFENNDILDPINVIVDEQGRYKINDGIHRVAASKLFKYTEVPAIVTRWKEISVNDWIDSLPND